MRLIALAPRSARPALLLGLALLLLLPMIGARDIVTSHEARVAQTARQMAETWPWAGKTLDVPEVTFKDIGRGVQRLAPVEPGRMVRVNPWLVPVLNQEIRLQKPPLPYWCAAVLFRLFGFGEGWARLVPALLGAAAVVFVYDLARLLLGRTAAWIAGLVWISTFFIIDEHRKAMADPFLAFFTLLSVWSWVRASQVLGSGEVGSGEVGEWWSGKGAKASPLPPSPTPLLPHFPTSPLPPSPTPLLLLFYLSLAFGLLAKGPVVLLHVGVALTLYHWCFRRRLPGALATHGIGVAMVLMIGLPWYAYVWLTVPHAADLWKYESIGELTADNTEHARDWWFYAPNLLLVSLPWIIPWAMGLSMPLARRQPGAAPDLLRDKAAGAAPLNPSSGSPASADEDAGRVPYRSGVDRGRLLMLTRRRRWRSAFAPLWLIIMVVFFSCLQQKKNAYLLPVMAAWTLMTTRGLGILIASARRWHFRQGSVFVPAIQAGAGVVFAVVLIGLLVATPSSARWTGLLLATAGLGIAIAASVAIVRRNAGGWIVRQTIAYGVLMATFLNFYIAPQEQLRSAKPLARQINSLLRRDGYTILVDHLPPEAAVYLPLNIRYEPKPHVLVVADDSRGVKNRRKQQAEFAMPKAEVFRTWVDDGTVVEVQLIPVPRMSGDSRWKLYDLTVDRRMVAGEDGPMPAPGITIDAPQILAADAR